MFALGVGIPAGYLALAVHHMNQITRDFEAATNLQRLAGKTETEVIQLLGKPYSHEKDANGQHHIEYKSREGEYAWILIRDGRVVSVDYSWQ